MFLALGGVACASGQRETQLAQAKLLISEKKYNDAILLLSEIIKRSPSRFDQAQSLLLQVEIARNVYNQKVAELIKVFNKGDLQAAYVILRELEALDRAPNQRTVDAQAYARETATVVYDNDQFHDIMEKALALLQAGKYYDAIELYESGYDLGTNFFESSDLGNIASGQVLGLQAQLKAKTRALLALRADFDAASRSLAAARASFSALSSAVDLISGDFSEMAAARAAVDATVDLLVQARGAILMQRSALQDVYLITYLEKLVRGRGGSEPPEGVLAAVDGLEARTLESAFAEAASLMDDSFANGRSRLAAADYGGSAASLKLSREEAQLAERIALLWDPRLSGDLAFARSDAEIARLGAALPDYLQAQTRLEAVDSTLALAAIDERLQAMAPSAGAAQTIDRFAVLKSAIDGVSDRLDALVSQWRATSERLGQFASVGYRVEKSVALAGAMLADLAAAQSAAGAIEVQVVARLSSERLELLQGELSQANASVGEAEGLLAGVSFTTGSAPDQTTIQAKYPSRSLDLLNGAAAGLPGIVSAIKTTVDGIDTEPESVVEATSTQAALAAARKLQDDTAALDARIRSDSGAAEQGVFQARRYRQDGENTLREIQEAMAQSQFVSAREEIATAASELDRSLSFEENPDVRQERDVFLSQLSRSVTDAENSLVVEEVRRSINEGKQYYAQGEYQSAREALTRAQARWRLTNTEDDPEIATWLGFVNTALAINTGRVIPPTDPLYGEMTQVLNLAHADYDRAAGLVAEGRLDLARPLFSDAEQKLDYVRVPFPFNEDARVLALRILKLSDPANFDAEFQAKFREALGELKTDTQAGYLALKDLEAIDPSYPGLEAAILETETATGMRRPPPDPRKIQEAQALYQKAFDIVRTNVRAQFPIALSYLNRAIELDPDNGDVTSLKDQLAIDSGGETTVVLSNAAQLQFRAAEEQFIAKSYYEALRTVNDLLRDPANQSYSPLLELKRRIESKI